MLNRRKLMAGAAALAGTHISRAAIAQPAPIRIGILSVKSGALATGGRQMEDGFQLFLKERGNVIAGRAIELFVADTGGQPALAKTRAQELVQRSNVHMIVGRSRPSRLLPSTITSPRHRSRSSARPPLQKTSPSAS